MSYYLPTKIFYAWKNIWLKSWITKYSFWKLLLLLKMFVLFLLKLNLVNMFKSFWIKMYIGIYSFDILDYAVFKWIMYLRTKMYCNLIYNENILVFICILINVDRIKRLDNELSFYIRYSTISIIYRIDSNR